MEVLCGMSDEEFSKFVEDLEQATVEYIKQNRKPIPITVFAKTKGSLVAVKPTTKENLKEVVEKLRNPFTEFIILTFTSKVIVFGSNEEPIHIVSIVGRKKNGKSVVCINYEVKLFESGECELVGKLDWEVDKIGGNIIPEPW